MSYDISIVQSVQGTQGYFDTSLQTFDLFGTGDREQNTEREREQRIEPEDGGGGERFEERRREMKREKRRELRRGEEEELVCNKASLLALVFNHIVLTYST